MNPLYFIPIVSLFAIIIFSGITENYDLMYYAVVGMIVSGFAILTIEIRSQNRITNSIKCNEDLK